MDLNTLKAIVEAGGTGIALFLAAIIYKIVTNHESHFTDAISKNTEALTKLCDCLDELKEKIK